MIQRYEFIRIFAENKSERRVCKKAKESAISRKQEHCDLKPETRQQTKTLINKGLYEDKPYRFGRTAAAARPDGRCDRSGIPRSEEHTSELQSRQYLVCRLLLEKKKTGIYTHASHLQSVT